MSASDQRDPQAQLPLTDMIHNCIMVSVQLNFVKSLN